MKKITCIIVVITLLLTAMTVVFFQNRSVSEVRIQGNHMIYDSLSEIEKYADIIKKK